MALVLLVCHLCPLPLGANSVSAGFGLVIHSFDVCVKLCGAQGPKFESHTLPPLTVALVSLVMKVKLVPQCSCLQSQSNGEVFNQMEKCI